MSMLRHDAKAFCAAVTLQKKKKASSTSSSCRVEVNCSTLSPPRKNSATASAWSRCQGRRPASVRLECARRRSDERARDRREARGRRREVVVAAAVLSGKIDKYIVAETAASTVKMLLPARSRFARDLRSA